jgi:hypothetical protein
MLQFIGGAYFYLYNKSLEQLNYFFARLTTMQDTMLSIKLCEQMKPTEKYQAVLEHLILTIMERDRLASHKAKPAKTHKPRKAAGPGSPPSKTIPRSSRLLW